LIDERQIPQNHWTDGEEEAVAVASVGGMIGEVDAVAAAVSMRTSRALVLVWPNPNRSRLKVSDAGNHFKPLSKY
jgi:hypothetical protein